MGNSKSKKVEKPGKNATVFDRERYNVYMRDQKIKKVANPKNKRLGVKEPAPISVMPAVPSAPVSMPDGGDAPPANLRSYDDEAIERMRYQLYNDSDAFLLNNILLSVQFFENYERETQQIKNNPVTDREHLMEEAMVRRHKHVFFADRLQDCVHEHVLFRPEKDKLEPLTAARFFVIYDNVEASEPGDTSDYSAVLDAPFYKLLIADCKEPGYVQLKKLEVLESAHIKDTETPEVQRKLSGNSIDTDSNKESLDSDEFPDIESGEDILSNKGSKSNDSTRISINYVKNKSINVHNGTSERRCSGPTKRLSTQAEKNNISHLKVLKNANNTKEDKEKNVGSLDDTKPKPILKVINRSHETTKAISRRKTNTDSEKSRASSAKQIESSETESDYGYATITESSTPKKVALSPASNVPSGSGTLPDECWYSIKVKSIEQWSDDEDEFDERSTSPNLYETQHYLSSRKFMDNFVNNFIIDLGAGLGMNKDVVNTALTQGASIYCDTLKNGTKLGCEIFPALIAAWPSEANQWIIRERKIIRNPRTNSQYQWPTRYMVNKTKGLGCLLVPVGCRSKRGVNPNEPIQWKILFPAAERYLESCLAHSHIRCYLFALTLHKAFMENRKTKMGVEASHIKNHLFWQCEDNYARWPEDRLGEALRIFLRRFFAHFGQARFPNYFIDTCNDFKSIPGPVLVKHQTQLRDILEAPVTHLLYALDKLKYTDKKFYPPFDSRRLYEILTNKNPLYIVNPNIPHMTLTHLDNSDSEEDTELYDKSRDKNYIWNKKKQQQIKERRRIYSRQVKTSKQTKDMNPKIILPQKMEMERLRLVLEFFISHFIAMARSSEKFEAIKQAIIYLEQAKRLCVLLEDEPGGDDKVNDYMDVIRDKLADCQRKLVNESSFKLPPRTESQTERLTRSVIRSRRPNYEQIVADSPTEPASSPAFTFVDIHVSNAMGSNDIKFDELSEESKL